MNDTYFMRRALELAARAHPSPNPRVGCVIVKHGRIIAEAFHQRAGEPHAEVLALRKAGRNAEGAILYVTLEPCCHQGKTPPCTDAILKAGITHVVAAMQDPNRLVRGKGFAQLRKAGINVKTGVGQDDAKRLNMHWLHFITRKRPYVICKIAQTLDGKICTKTGDSRWITGTEARNSVHRLRAEVDAVLVGINTILTDDPHLTAHGRGRDPKRVILDSRLRIPLRAKVLKDRNCIIVTGQNRKNGRGRKRQLLEKKGVCVITVPAMRWQVILTALAKQDITSLLIEGGSAVFTSAFEQKAINEVYWFIAPKIVGGEKTKTAVIGDGFPSMRQAQALKQPSISIIGTDVCIHGFL